MADLAIRTLNEIRTGRVSLDYCCVCGDDIHVMCRRGTGICSENCQKKQATIKESDSASE